MHSSVPKHTTKIKNKNVRKEGKEIKKRKVVESLSLSEGREVQQNWNFDACFFHPQVIRPRGGGGIAGDRCAFSKSRPYAEKSFRFSLQILVAAHLFHSPYLLCAVSGNGNGKRPL